jgi:hypothetical protein
MFGDRYTTNVQELKDLKDIDTATTGYTPNLLNVPKKQQKQTFSPQLSDYEMNEDESQFETDIIYSENTQPLKFRKSSIGTPKSPKSKNNPNATPSIKEIRGRRRKIEKVELFDIEIKEEDEEYMVSKEPKKTKNILKNLM